MAVNRFTNLTPSAYKPMTSQEIMMVPLAMREQHNKTQAAIQSQMAELDKIRALPVHTEEAMARKNQLIKNIDALSSDLANKGFSNDMTSKLIQLNRNIKDEFSPSGRLGQIAGAYDTYFKEKEAFEKSNADKKWDDERKQFHWGKHTQGYQGYDEKGNIINIGSLSAPEKVLLSDRFQKLKSIMGDANLAYKTLNGDTTWRTGANGELYSRDNETGEEIKYNNPQVVGILRSIITELNDPTSDLSKSREYSGQSIEQALEESSNLAKSMVNVEKGYTNKSKEDVHGYKNLKDIAKEEAANGVSLVDVSEDVLHNQNSYGQAIHTINRLQNISKTRGLTDDEKEQYTIAKGLELNYKNNIKDINIGDKFIKENGKTLAQHYASELKLPAGKRVNFKYVEKLYDDSKNKFLSSFKKGTKEYALAEAHLNGDPNNLILQNIATGGGASSKTKELEKVSNIFNQIVGNKQKIYHNYKNDIFKYGNNYSSFYMPVTSDSQSETGKKFEVLNNILSDNLKSSSSENTLGNISSVTDSNGKVHRLGDYDDVGATRKNIVNVMRKSKSIKPVGYSDNDGGFPSIKFMVTPNENDDYSEDIQNTGFIDDVVGKGKSFEVTLRLGDFSNIQNNKNKYGTNSAILELFNTIEKTGDAKSKEFVRKAKERLNNISGI